MSYEMYCVTERCKDVGNGISFRLFKRPASELQARHMELPFQLPTRRWTPWDTHMRYRPRKADNPTNLGISASVMRMGHSMLSLQVHKVSKCLDLEGLADLEDLGDLADLEGLEDWVLAHQDNRR
jgi:hypothetical protein